MAGDLVVFQGSNIRRTLHNDEWWFAVEDVVRVLTDSVNAKDYINKMRKRDEALSEGYGQIVHTLPLETAGGIQKVNCANTAGIFRIIQSIPSKKAEPFKMWLAKVGYERVQEIENPELAQHRMREIYRAKGYPDAWIEKRIRGIVIREELTDEWKNRGVKEGKEYSILTSDISKATFSLTPTEHKELKGFGNSILKSI